jgi:hypothetical protein
MSVAVDRPKEEVVEGEDHGSNNSGKAEFKNAEQRSFFVI